jgi:predicted metal-binding membrane protein
VAWAALLRMSRHMAGMSEMPGMLMPWTPPDLLMLATMWSVMMVAMMLPTVTPFILLFASVQRARATHQRPAVRTTVFVAGYLIVWIGFALVASGIQWVLHERALLSESMQTASRSISGMILVGAGIYQWLPVKQVCLHHCRSPLGMMSTEWREGTRGAVIMGLRHGTYCLGCCWLLMTLLFVVGVMNLLWIAAICLLVLIEKTLPRGLAVARAGGVALVSAGIWLLVS